jgi:hypothetical protein
MVTTDIKIKPDILFPRMPAPNTQHIGTNMFQDRVMNDEVRE